MFLDPIKSCSLLSNWFLVFIFRPFDSLKPFLGRSVKEVFAVAELFLPIAMFFLLLLIDFCNPLQRLPLTYRL